MNLVTVYRLFRDRLGQRLKMTLLEFLRMYQRQGGRCTLSGQVLYWENLTMALRDHRRDYTLDNTDLTTVWANKMRYSLSNSEFVQICRAVAQKHSDAL